MYLAIFQQLAVALILSSLVGLERERRHQMYDYKGFGGIRTFALIGLLSALTYHLAGGFTGFFVLITAGFLAMVITAYFIVAKNNKMTGTTSEFASILVYLIGILCAREEYVVATAMAILVLLILHFKDVLHKWAKQLQNEEVVSTIQFMIIAFVVLPLLPNENFGPYGFFNPYVIWLMVVFISGISFVSYIAIKLLGEKRGITLMGFLGGLISSTALTLSLAAQSKKNPAIVTPYAASVVIASSAMFFRLLIEVAVLNMALLDKLIVPMSAMGFTGILGALFLLKKGDNRTSDLHISKDVAKFKSPFSIGPAVKFAVVFAVIIFCSKFAVNLMGDKGLYLTSLISGFVDVDPITVHAATAARSGLLENTAVNVITIAAMVNTFAKALMFTFFGARKVAYRVSIVFAIMMAMGGLSLLFF